MQKPADDDAEIIDCLQSTAYGVLEDMRRLKLHSKKNHRGHEAQASRFLDLVNRKRFVFPGDPDGLRIFEGQEASELVRFPVDKSMKETLDALSKGFTDQYLPPPLWLRLLPICLRILEGCQFKENAPNKNEDMKGVVCRWLAFNVDPSVGKRKDRISETVNINSVGKVTLQSGPWRALTEILFDPREMLAAGGLSLRDQERTGTIPYPYTCWGIRFRTVGPMLAEISEEDFRPWMDIHVTTDMKSYDSEESVSVEHKGPQLGFPNDPLTEKLFEGWARDINQGKSLNVSSYLNQLHKFYPDGSRPEAGMDCLLCPGIFWSPNEWEQGTSATIFWGFEGEIPSRVARRLLRASQLLLSGIGQVAGMLDLEADAAQAAAQHKERRMLNDLGHEVKKVRTAITKDWIPSVRELFKVHQSPGGNGAWPDKLGTLILANEAMELTGELGIDQFGVAPFRDTLLSAVDLIDLWCGVVDSAGEPFAETTDQPMPDSHRKLKNLIVQQWRNAIKVIVFFSQSGEKANTVERIRQLRSYFDDIQAILPLRPVITITARKPIPIDINGLQSDRTAWLSRLFFALFTNSLQHGDPARPTVVTIDDGKELSKTNQPFDFRLTIANTRKRRDKAAIADDLMAAAARKSLSKHRLDECMYQFQYGMEVGARIGSESSTKQVAINCCEELGDGTLIEWPEPATVLPGSEFSVSFEFSIADNLV